MGIFSSIGSGIGSIFGGSDGGAIGGGLLGIGDWLLNRHDSRDAASRANKYALYASGTAHQREVADLRAAGLNPILSALGGNGAAAMPVPVGNSYNRDDNNAQEVLGYVSAQRMAQQNRREEELNRAQVRLLREQARKLSAEADHAQNLVSVDIDANPVANFLTTLLARDDRLRALSTQMLTDQIGNAVLGLGSYFKDRFTGFRVEKAFEDANQKFADFYEDLEKRNAVESSADGEDVYIYVKTPEDYFKMLELWREVERAHENLESPNDLPKFHIERKKKDDD